jgi:hypothetical protein
MTIKDADPQQVTFTLFSPEMLDQFCDLLIMKLQGRGLCIPTFQVD